ncbi:DUF6220 domain-containing protein [Nodosilinea sp. PGN35]|uniref:DUF6220 domain-containing protein n=1 Tax=Nodosilinea sp. PGN35 TaxID=3020489 RepID=UPI0023B28506|nr:DUF6220 domain-containing protein [Nodosilinea sp. TSF1-S3]MDF0368735.1 DUF6220 domain-containing protein [Nodosilinea sp. TSF1-S3]
MVENSWGTQRTLPAKSIPILLAMTTSISNSPDSSADQLLHETPLLTRGVVLGFYAVAIVFNLCLAAQLLTVGLAYFYDSTWWNLHVWLVRGYGGLSLIMLLWACWMPFSNRIKTLTITLTALLGLQFATIHLRTPLPLAIFHPLIGFSLFSISTTLVHRVKQVLSPEVLSPKVDAHQA